MARVVRRYYDPSTEQFLSVDPLVNVTGTPYAYTGGNPVNASDPSGLDCDWTSIFSPWRHESCFKQGWNKMSGPEQAADATLPLTLPLGGAACVLLSVACATALGVSTTVGIDDPNAPAAILDAASQGSGDFGAGSGYCADANAIGEDWVGPNARLSSNGRALLSENGLRAYRFPQFKPSLGVFQANLESRGVPYGPYGSNGHVTILQGPPAP